MPMTWRSSGGVSDGNTLAALGLPVIDTMGASGGNIHTHDEYINLDKLVARAQHLALVLMYLAHQQAHHGEKS
jgi:glutamate carboxypeptidase